MPTDMDRAAELVAAGNFGKAEKLLRELREKNPESRKVHELLARCYLETEKFAKALKEIKALLRRDPANPDYRLTEAQCLSFTGRMDEAWEKLEGLHDLSGKDADYHYARSLILMRRDDYKGALDEASRALGLLGEGGIARKRRQFLHLERMACHRFLGERDSVVADARSFVAAHEKPQDALLAVEALGSPVINHAVASALLELVPDLKTEQMEKYLKSLEEAIPKEMEFLAEARKKLR